MATREDFPKSWPFSLLEVLKSPGGNNNEECRWGLSGKKPDQLYFYSRRGSRTSIPGGYCRKKLSWPIVEVLPLTIRFDLAKCASIRHPFLGPLRVTEKGKRECWAGHDAERGKFLCGDQKCQRTHSLKIEKILPEGVYINGFLDRSMLIDKTTSTIRGKPISWAPCLSSSFRSYLIGDIFAADYW